MKLRTWLLLSAVVFLAVSCQNKAIKTASQNQIDHVVVIYLENHSFYNLFAKFPGAENSMPPGYHGQVDKQGRVYTYLPPVKYRHKKKADPRFPAHLRNHPFRIDTYAGLSQKTPDPNHEFYTSQVELDGGKMDRFAAYSSVGALTMGYYKMRKTHLWKYAQEYTLADHFFQSVYGGSFVNHAYMIAARVPFNPDVPKKYRIALGPDGAPTHNAPYTPDGYAVNTVEPLLFPHDPKVKDPSKRLPPQTYDTIGDLLNRAGVSWAWYAGGWNEVLSGHPPAEFQYHHLPFIYFKNYGPNTEGRREHIKGEKDLFAAIREHHLPHVVFYKPLGDDNEHPGYSTVHSGDECMHRVVEALQKSSYWKHTLVIVTFDESGGFWDPVAPPKVDRFGLGVRIPAVFISPLVKKGYVDHTIYETVSIISYIEKRFGLPHLTKRDAAANPLSNIFM